MSLINHLLLLSTYKTLYKKIITGLFAVAAFTFNAVAQTNNNTDQKQWNKEGQKK